MALLKITLPWTNYNGLLGPVHFTNSEAVVPGVRSDQQFQRLDSILSGIIYEDVVETSFSSPVERSNAKSAPTPRPRPKPRPQAIGIEQKATPATRPPDTGACFEEVDDDEPVEILADDGEPGDMLATDRLPPKALPPSPVELEARIKAVQAAAAKKGKVLVKAKAPPAKIKKGKK